MSRRDLRGDGRTDRLLTNWLWLAAAAMVVAGFLLRILASLMSRAELRLTGVVIIGVGIGVAALGWLSERWSERHPS